MPSLLYFYLPRDPENILIQVTKCQQRSTTQHKSFKLLESALKSNSSNLYCHDVDAGHWLHAEKPKELFDVMVGAVRGWKKICCSVIV